MKNGAIENVTEYPEICEKTVEKAFFDQNTLHFIFTDKSSFLITPKPLPTTKFSILKLYNDNVLDGSVIQDAHLEQMTSVPISGTVFSSANLHIMTDKGLFTYEIKCDSATTNRVELDCKLTDPGNGFV